MTGSRHALLYFVVAIFVTIPVGKGYLSGISRVSTKQSSFEMLWLSGYQDDNAGKIPGAPK